MWVRLRAGWLLLAAALVVGLGFLGGCGGDNGGPQKPLTLTGTCTGCHEDAEKLQATAAPGEIPTEGDAGEG
jgi:hypothetical protein